MIVKFDKEYLSELFYYGKSSDKKHRFQPNVIQNYKRRIETLNNAPNIESLYALHALNYEILVGDKKGISSIRINKQYRLEFAASYDIENELTITICNILDITNHYK
ncbi:MAG: type II toxin-antitoxin system RelE/ParE family toxin [Parabacteroides sp.]|nr:type II toxin-antitoxin system RelE/ParE family toxin [Parabacteroides sp.]